MHFKPLVVSRVVSTPRNVGLDGGSGRLGSLRAVSPIIQHRSCPGGPLKLRQETGRLGKTGEDRCFS